MAGRIPSDHRLAVGGRRGPDDERGADPGPLFTYPFGAGEAMLLEARAPGWRSEFPHALTLGSLLNHASSRQPAATKVAQDDRPFPHRMRSLTAGSKRHRLGQLSREQCCNRDLEVDLIVQSKVDSRLQAIMLAVSTAGLISAAPAPQTQTLVIETRIVGDPQAGMKSRQTVTVDFDNRTATSIFETGVTNIGVGNVASIRDRFTVETASIDGQRAELLIRGRTASGVVVMPNIDYAFTVEIRRNGSGRLSGCHDGYPGYEVRQSGRVIYSFIHEPTRIDRLFGDCDISVGAKAF